MTNTYYYTFDTSGDNDIFVFDITKSELLPKFPDVFIKHFNFFVNVAYIV